MIHSRFFFIFIFQIIALMTSCSQSKRVEAKEGVSHVPYSSSKAMTAALPQRMKPLIILDAGHGGTDEGAKVNTFMEKRITLLTTLMAKKHLEELGYRIILTRSRDVFISLQKRVSIANKTKGALFVSIHYNASKSPEAKGLEVYYSESKEIWRTSSSKRLANCVLAQLVDQTEAPSRGIKSGNFHVIRETEMPAILVEGGFVTNGEERTLLKDREYLDRIAKGIAFGIDKYLRS